MKTETLPEVVTIRIPRAEFEGIVRAVPVMLRCSTDAAMVSITPGEPEELAVHRRAMLRFYWLLTGHTWAWEEEEGLTLLQRCRCLLLIVKPYLPLRLQTACGVLAGRLARVIERRGGYGG